MVKFSLRARLYVCHYIYRYMVYVWPDNQYHAHSHCVHTLTPLFLTLRRGNQITIQTESERERDCTQRFIKDKYTIFISTRATLLQRYLSAYNKDEVATLRSVQSRITNIFCVMCYYWRTTKNNNCKFR